MINASWDTKGNSKNLTDTIGLMVYEGTNSLNYVKIDRIQMYIAHVLTISVATETAVGRRLYSSPALSARPHLAPGM